MASLMILMAVGAIACGGSDEGGSELSSGLFIDAEVEGLAYRAGNTSGTTDENGTYWFIPGQPITFSVGGVEIGTAQGAPACTPRDFGVAQNNIARFLQSLDADGDPSNGIDLVDAQARLSGVDIPASAFEVSAVAFGNDTAISGAISIGNPGAVLIDESTAVTNLNAGTDLTFDKNEIAGQGFIVIIPSENDIGYFGFDPLADPSNTGSASTSIFFSETLVGDGEGEGTDYSWDVDLGTGVMTLTNLDDISDVVTLLRQGGSSRSIGFTFTTVEAQFPQAGTLIRPIIVTALDLAGGSSRAYDVSTPSGVSRVTFDADGTFDILDSDQGTDTGTWSIDDNEVLLTLAIDGATEVIGAVLIDGDFESGGTLVVAEGSMGQFWPIWVDLFDAPIVPVLP